MKKLTMALSIASLVGCGGSGSDTPEIIYISTVPATPVVVQPAPVSPSPSATSTDITGLLGNPFVCESVNHSVGWTYQFNSDWSITQTYTDIRMPPRVVYPTGMAGTTLGGLRLKIEGRNFTILDLIPGDDFEHSIINGIDRSHSMMDETFETACLKERN